MKGYASIDKPWLRYYPQYLIDKDLPKATIYDYILKNNNYYPKRVALNYFNNKITYAEMFEQIEYLLFEKATDSDNGSTVSRTVPLLVNWGAFMEHPIFGVGNGLQGYYYEKFYCMGRRKNAAFKENYSRVS